MKFFCFSDHSATDDDLDEWARHHDDPRHVAAEALWHSARQYPDMTPAEIIAAWQEANKLVGNRAPADYAEFVAYGYFEGRQDALRATRE